MNRLFNLHSGFCFPHSAWIFLLCSFCLGPATTAKGQVQSDLQGLSSILRFGGVSRDLDMTEQQKYDLNDLWIEIRG